MLARHDLLERRPVAFLERRNRREAVQRLRVLGFVRFAVQRVVAVEQPAGASSAEQEPAARQLEVDLGRFVDGRRHLRCQEAAPDELVELEEVALQVFLQVVRRQPHFRRPDRFVGILDLRAPPALVDIRLVGQIALVELRVDVLTGLLDRGIRHADGVGAHVGDQTDRPLLAELHPFVQLLGGPHRTAG